MSTRRETIIAARPSWVNWWPFGAANHNALAGTLMILVPLALLTTAAHLFLGPATQDVIAIMYIEMVAVVALFIFVGNSGVGSFGHVVFMGLGAHVGALLAMDPTFKATLLPDLPHWLGQVYLGPWLAIVVSMALVGLFALLIGIPVSRLSGSTAGITTLCMLIVMFGVLKAAKGFTAGNRALYGFAPCAGLWAAFGWAAASIFVARVFRDSVAGLELRASREDELAAQSIGINFRQRRLIAWVLSGVISAAAGFLLGQNLGVVSPSMFYLNLTFTVVAMLIVGGMTTVSGAVIGTLILTMVLEFLRHLESGMSLGPLQLPEMFGLTTLGLGVSIMAVMFWRRDGLLAYFEIDERLARRRRRRTAGNGHEGLHPSAVPLRPAGSASTPVPELAPRPNDANQRLIVEHVCKEFGGLRALHEVSLHLAHGEILGLIGPNGAGKTTLLNLVAGADSLTSGRIVIEDQDITSWPAHRIARQGIGRTFQNIRLFSHLTVLENVVAGATASGADLGSKTPEKWARQVIREFNLDGFVDLMAGTLAYGQQRTLEIARALAIQPRYLLLDEPAAGMNRTEKNHLIDLIRGVRADYGIGLLVVDHDLRLIAQLCERIVVLNEGEVIAEGSPREIQQDTAVIEAYIGSKRKEDKPGSS